MIWDPTGVRGSCSASDLRVCHSADSAHADNDQPQSEETEEQSDNCPRKSVNQPDSSGILLAGSLEQNCADAADDSVNNERQQCAGQGRQNEIRHSKKWA